MSFYDFMISKYLGENSPLGDIAHDMEADGDFPRESADVREIKDYFVNISLNPSLHATLDKALREFNKQ